MAEDKPRLARLAAIMTQLQSKRLVTARDIANRHDVSIRTVYRDIRTLEQSGVPIITEEGKGYSIMDGYVLPPVMFSEDEANALITAEHLILKNKDQSLSEHYSSAVTKIRSILKGSQQTKTELLSNRIQIRNNPGAEKTSNYLIQLQSYIANFQVVEMKYLSLSNYQSQRSIEPFALYTTQDNWIMIAYCRLKSDFRAFRLDRIQHLKRTDEVFEPHNMTLEEYLEECRKTWEQTPDIPLTQGTSTFVAHQKNVDMQKVIIEPFKAIGIAVRTTNEDGRGVKDIGDLWARFMSEGIADKIPNRVEQAIYSLYTDYEGDHTQPYTAMLICKVDSLDDIPDGMTGRSFAGGNYVKITATGDLTKGMIGDQWAKIGEMGLDRSFTADYEIFDERSHDSANAEIDFLIAVR